MNPTWLSILIPSNRPEGLKIFIESLKRNAVAFDSIEIIVLVDSRESKIEINENVKTIYFNRSNPLNMSDLNYQCYKNSSSNWIMMANDDLICETPEWDIKIKTATRFFSDEIALIYPNDGMFGKELSCFPIISRKLLESIQFFPQYYHRYKIDDTLFHIFPNNRKIYLDDVKMIHLNNKGETGYILPLGGIYPTVDIIAAYHDNNVWIEETPRRNRMAQIIREMIREVKIKVFIAVPTNEYARRADFYDYYNALEKPEGTIATFAHGQSPAKNRNIMIRLALEHNATHILFLDDDMAFKPDLLNRLLSHNVDIVSGLYLLRNYPHFPLMFDERYDDGKCRYKFLNPKINGLVEVVNTGLGCCLIKTDVFRVMLGNNNPNDFHWITLGEYDKDNWCDDISFFNRSRDTGFKIYVDTEATCGHIMSAIIWPRKDENGNWFTVYNTGSPESFQVPQIVPSNEEVLEKTGNLVRVK